MYVTVTIVLYVPAKVLECMCASGSAKVYMIVAFVLCISQGAKCMQ